jgi:hypothetical protein
MQHQSSNNNFVDEWALFVKAVSFLAILTGLLYLRVMISGGGPLLPGHNPLTTGALRAIITIVAIGGILACWRQPVAGAAVAIVSGLLLGWQVYETAAHSPLLLAGAYASPFILTGALYLVYAWRKRAQ